MLSFLFKSCKKKYLEKGCDAHVIYFEGDSQGLEKNESVWGVNPRSPLNIIRIRKFISRLSKKAGKGGSNQKLIVHVHLTWPWLYVALASVGFSNIRLFYTEHSTTNKRRSIPMSWAFERLLYSRYDHIVCISQGVHCSLAEWIGAKVARRLVTIPNGSRIYSLAERPILEGRLPRLVSVGSLSSRKNFKTVVRAIGQIRDEIDTYTIIGEGPERRKLEQIIKEERLEEKVFLAGWSESIESFLHASDIQLIPSLWEGFGLVAVEGMSTGLPVVASNVDGLREVLGQSNPSVTLVGEPESMTEWVKGIRTSVENLHMLGGKVLANSSRRQAENFTLDSMADRYLELYRR